MKYLRSSYDRIVVAVFLLVSSAPFFWLVGTSLKSEDLVQQIPPRIIPNFELTAYKSIIQNESMQKTLTNSFVTATGATLLCITLGTMASFALINLSSKRHVEFEFWILSSRLAPVIAIVLPLFIVYQALGIQDTILGLVFAHSVMLIGLVTWILLETFRAIPSDVLDASEVDGCSNLQIFRLVVVPLSRSSIIGVASLSFLLSWNEFFLSLVLTSSDAMTVQVLLYQSIGYQTFSLSQLAATSVVVLTPTIVVVSLFQKQLIQGLTFGSVKG
jgi:multiple sugar transport system permease protein